MMEEEKIPFFFSGYLVELRLTDLLSPLSGGGGSENEAEDFGHTTLSETPHARLPQMNTAYLRCLWAFT